MKDQETFRYVSPECVSNCMIEAIKAKLRNPRCVRIYFCKPHIMENSHFQMCHFMWTDGKADYDFSDDENRVMPWYKCLLFKGRIRQFRLGFAARYTATRNRS